MTLTACEPGHNCDADSPIAWLRDQLLGVRRTGSPQRVITTLTGREHLWWDCCHEAARRHASWFGEQETGQVRDWIAQSVADEASGTAVLLYVDTAFTLARAVSAAPAGGLSGPDRERLARRWEATGLMLPSSSQPGYAMTATAELMLTGPGPLRRAVTIPVLFGLADERGEIHAGSAAYLELRALPSGPAGLFPDPRFVPPRLSNGSAFGQSLAHAWTGLPRRGKERCVLWRIRFPDAPDRVPSLEGGSLGAAFAVGLRELSRYPAAARFVLGGTLRWFYGLRPRTALTGVVDADQSLGHVTAMGAKLSAAHHRKWRVIAPKANLSDRAQAPDPAMVRFAGTVRQADRYARQWRIGRLVTVIALIASSSAAGTFSALQASGNAAKQQAALRASANLGAYVVSQLNTPLFDPSQITTDALLAVDAYRTAPTPQAAQALFDTYADMSPYAAILGTYAGTADDSGLSVDRSGTFAVVTRNTTAEVWYLPRELSARRLMGTINDVTAAQISLDGSRIGAVGIDGSLQLWTTAPLRKRAQVRLPADVFGPPHDNTKFRFDAETRYLAIAGQFSPFVWNLSTGRLTKMPEPGLADQAIDEVGFIGASVVYDVQPNKARFFWSVATGKEVPAPRNPDAPVQDSENVTARCTNSTWKFDYAVSGRPVPGLHAGMACTGKTSAAALNGHFFVAVQPTGADYSAKFATIIDLRSGLPVAEAGLSSNAQVVGVDPAGGRLFVQGTPSGVARLWPAAQASLPRGVSAEIVSLNGRFLAQILYPGPTAPTPRIRIVSAQTDQELHVLSMPTGSYAPDSVAAESVSREMFLPNGQLLVLADGILTLWDVQKGTMTSSPMVLASAAANTGTGPSQVPPDPVISVNPVLNDEIAATGPDGTTVEIWRTTGWRQVRTIGPLPNKASEVEFSPDGTSIGVMMQDGTVEVFKTSDGSEITAVTTPGSGTSPGFWLLGSGYLALTDTDYLYLWRGRSQIARITPPASTFFNFPDNGGDGGELTVDLISELNGEGISTPHEFSLAPQPSQWARDICEVVGRQLTSAELSLPGPDMPDNGC